MYSWECVALLKGEFPSSLPCVHYNHLLLESNVDVLSIASSRAMWMEDLKEDGSEIRDKVHLESGPQWEMLAIQDPAENEKS
jgi:hypothetical protein